MLFDSWPMTWFVYLNVAILALTVVMYAIRELKHRSGN